MAAVAMPLYKHTAQFSAPLKGLSIVPEQPPVPPEPVFSKEQLEKAVADARTQATQMAQSQLVPQIQQAREQAEQLQTGVFSQLDNRFESVMHEMYERMPELVMILVKRVLCEVTMTEESIKAIVLDTLSEISSEAEKMEVRLAPGDLELLKDADNELENRFPNLNFKADKTLSSGDCMLHSRFGVVDARVETKLQKIFDDLKHKE